ncbi:hypothetical protein HBI56_021510 [Parastagonospora nodorum]|uniref:Uncharacterized protein n=1 Tax=Phaeosphaeria nodorum (strain SN15 / ATCC MYA-4574 / FGSC 10173) TaxID=321614 RepID=A0A7U2F0Y0_PHANO|nr:hypothetical protein HBH56_174480 [Parastagonospora nodorum]QRC96352.1 hypothetical protein JI435_408810 [Parastagonospora nodorum SN15]KAH3926468.1 hypothetical protein HBH54_168670 [Parastagonospora nodorum]KAH3955468.1 hypothetical protein HBH53_001490 [Parastagonospora nodorum]KAH3965697.1 hypothetical protein HBH52_205340 [Parastagonospora nodorum]
MGLRWNGREEICCLGRRDVCWAWWGGRSLPRLCSLNVSFRALRHRLYFFSNPIRSTAGSNNILVALPLHVSGRVLQPAF